MSVSRQNIRTKRRRRERQEAWEDRTAMRRVWGFAHRRPVLLMEREDSTAWTTSAPGRGKSIVRYTSGGKPHVSPVFVYPGGPL